MSATKVMLTVTMVARNEENKADGTWQTKGLLTREIKIKHVPTVGTRIILHEPRKSGAGTELVQGKKNRLGIQTKNANDSEEMKFPVIAIFTIDKICYFVDRNLISLYSTEKSRTHEQSLYVKEQFKMRYDFIEVTEI